MLTTHRPRSGTCPVTPSEPAGHLPACPAASRSSPMDRLASAELSQPVMVSRRLRPAWLSCSDSNAVARTPPSAGSPQLPVMCDKGVSGPLAAVAQPISPVGKSASFSHAGVTGVVLIWSCAANVAGALEMRTAGSEGRICTEFEFTTTTIPALMVARAASPVTTPRADHAHRRL